MPAEQGQRLTVRAGGARVAMAASSVSEVIRMPRITRMPHGPAGLLGVTHLRGLILPVVSLGQLLGREGGGADRVVVMRRDPPLGLAVDAVEALRAETAETLPDGRLRLDGEGSAPWLDLDAALLDRFAAFRGTRRPAELRQDSGAKGPAVQELGFLAFTLAEQAYALPLPAVTEVLPLPASLTKLPQTEAALLGVFELRGEVLPAVSLRALLGLPVADLTGAEKVLVVRLGGFALALVVDGISAILRAAPDRLAPAPSLFNRGGGEARIEAVLRLPGESGLVSILSPGGLLADGRVARLLADTASQKDQTMASPAAAASRERFIVIRLGPEAYALPIGAVDEVVRVPDQMTRLPGAPAYVRGVMSLRGRVIPVIDLRRRFAAGSDAEKGSPLAAGRVVVVTLGPLQAGFAVDEAADILEVDAAGLLPAPDVSEGGGPVFDRAATIERNGEFILVIDPASLLSRAEADLLRDLTGNSRPS